MNITFRHLVNILRLTPFSDNSVHDPLKKPHPLHHMCIREHKRYLIFFRRINKMLNDLPIFNLPESFFYCGNKSYKKIRMNAHSRVTSCTCCQLIVFNIIWASWNSANFFFFFNRVDRLTIHITNMSFIIKGDQIDWTLRVLYFETNMIKN